jgi:hypothetical protein
MSKEILGTIQCPQCYGEVDSRASVCPHCRKQLKAKRSVGYATGSLFVVFGLAAAMFGLLLGGDLLIYGAIAVLLGYLMRKMS